MHTLARVRWAEVVPELLRPQAVDQAAVEAVRPDDLRSKRVALTPRGSSAIVVLREAVGELETVWAEQLGPERFAQLRELLLELDQLTS